MKKLFILAPFAMAALLTLVGCAECDEVTSEDSDSKVPVKLTATTQSAVLRRAATNINEGALTSGSVSVRTSSSYTTAYAYTAGAGGVLSSDAPAFYPAGGANIDIVAYSPADASAATSNTFTVSADQRGTAGYVASDLLWGRVENKNSSSGSVDIAFSHKMAKIIVRVTATGGVSYVNSITMKNVKRQCLFTYETGAISNVAYVSGENQDVVAVSSETANTTDFSVGAVCIPAQTIPAGDFITIATDQGDVVYQLGEDKTVAAGNCYTVNITVTTENVAAGINTIESWAGGAGDGLDIAAIAAQTYTGSAVTPAITVTDGGKAVASGNYEVYYTNNINAGTATVYAVGKNTYAGKVGVKEFTINKATIANGSWSIDKTTMSIAKGGATSTISVSRTGNGAVQAVSSDEDIATVSVSGTTVTVTSGSNVGSATVTITVADGDNHTYAGNHTCTVTTMVYAGVLNGQFTVNGSGKQVMFSQGNLQATYNGSSWTWAFATNQWTYIGNAAGNTKVSSSSPYVSGYSGSSTTVDLFGWVGASSTWTGVNKYGITSSTSTNSTNGYGISATEKLKSDWGTLAITNGGNTANSGWFTLSKDEWVYLFNTRTASTVGGTANGRYAKATVNGVSGVILFPDSYTHPDGVTAPASVNTSSANFTANSYDATAWGKMETAGAVFLPAAGYRDGTTVLNAGSFGFYWSSSPDASSVLNAYSVNFNSSYLNPQNYSRRGYGFSVRLVRQVE
ncbi:fimbrillin family protein [Prevotella sp. E15-22]|uniref:fimbrillin family protein n=1 Tax=Prevotella sp. E15-22 TaxID=2937774 RepID=UPI0020463A32|nr:fimbrillin family protein [Prevotella sp. E15-22]UPS45040.1 fimbrillin family protein [Prevotella sp. E15-22]